MNNTMDTKDKKMYAEQETLAERNADFEKRWAEGIPIEEARRQTLEFIASWPWKEK